MSLDSSKFLVGVSDTTLFEESIPFKNSVYHGPSPLFVKIWFPINDAPSAKPLTFGELIQPSTNETFHELSDLIYEKSLATLVETSVEYDLADNEIQYQNVEKVGVIESIFNLQTESYPSSFNDHVSFPVIVYHHGAGGLPQENYKMAEYFASIGYVFVAAYFHFPYDEMPWSSAPFLSDIAYKNDVIYSKKLVDFAHKITDNKVYFMGHSWGAQSGWASFHDTDLIDGLISLETTLEYKSEDQIANMWPELYAELSIVDRCYSFPIALFSSLSSEKKCIFDNVCTKQLTHINMGDEFLHNSYTSCYLLRNVISKTFHFVDREELKAQMSIYNEMLVRINTILDEWNTFPND